MRFENFYVIGAKENNAENLYQEVNTAKKILCHIGIRVGDKLAVCYSAVSILHPPNLELSVSALAFASKTFKLNSRAVSSP